MSSSFGLEDGSLEGTTSALGTGPELLDGVVQLRRPITAAMATISARATTAYFALPPETGTPAGGRLEGGLISLGGLNRKEASRVRPCEARRV